MTILLLVIAYRTWLWGAQPANGPLIAISADTAWHSQLGLTISTYEVALARVGARYVIIRPEDGQPDQVLDRVDGLLLAGGGDIDPALYRKSDPAAELVDRIRDDFELALIRGALARNMPILGVCRGIQILNVAHGGTIQTLRNDPQRGPHHGGRIQWPHTHAVEVAKGSRLATIIGAGSKNVNAFHGQAVHQVGNQIDAVATTADGVVEAIERKDRQFVMAVQWHPEILSIANAEELSLFRALVRAANHYRSPQSP